MKNMIFIALALLLSSCGGGGGGGVASGSSPTNPEEQDQDQSQQQQVCYLGEKNDNKECLLAKDIDGAALGYQSPYNNPDFMGTGVASQYRPPIRALPLDELLPQTKLAPNFTLVELMNYKKDSFGIFSPYVVRVLQKIRDLSEWALLVNSAFRSPKYNAGVQGAAKWSRHQYGDAVDLSSQRLTLDQLAKFCKDLGADFTDKYEKHVHCDWRTQRLPIEFFGAEKQEERSVFNIKEYVAELEKTAELLWDGSLRAGSSMTFYSTVRFVEDTEPLYKQWRIKTPSGKIYEFTGQQLGVLLEKGTYFIQHTIGEHILIEKYITIGK